MIFRFLRRRHGKLLKIRSLELEVGKNSVQLQSSDIQRKHLEKGKDSLNEAAFGNPCPVLVSHSDLVIAFKLENMQFELEQICPLILMGFCYRY